MKKFVEPKSAKKGLLVQPAEQPQEPGREVEHNPATTVSQLAPEVQECSPNPSPGNSVVTFYGKTDTNAFPLKGQEKRL